MQNTARAQAHPNTLIKNFFIAGIEQEDLLNELYMDVNATPLKLKDNFEPIQPKVLFTMYQPPDVVSSRLHFVFPDKIQVKFKSAEIMLPKFFTFMNLDNDVEQQYFHTMIFYEEISKKSIVEDYDAEAEYKRVLENEKRNKRKADEKRLREARLSTAQSFSSQTNLSEGDEEDDMKFDKQSFNKKQRLHQMTFKGKKGVTSKGPEEGGLDVIHESNEGAELPMTHTGSVASDQQSNHSYASQEQSDQDDDVILYLPVAFVIVTEVEYHDIFRELSLDLFENLRQLPNPKDKQGQDLKVAFADRRQFAFTELIAKIAFLKTIPCPTFNTRFNIEFHDKTLVIEEKDFHAIPDNNQIAIKLLMKVMDIKSIIFCWKALLFDYSLVLISSQYSLQFNIAEALKQLMFPLTWQNAYIQPTNKETKDLVESPSPVFLCTSDELFDGNAFEYLEDLRESICPNLAICDIDGNTTNENELKFPQMYEEKIFVKTLNQIKNQVISQFDLAYPTESAESDAKSLVSDVRMLFFNALALIIRPVIEKGQDGKLKYFNEIDKLSVRNVFNEYFRRDQLIDEIYEGTQFEEFATKLVDSGAFQHFCDDSFENEITNFKVFEAIINGGDMTIVNNSKNALDLDPSNNKEKNIELPLPLKVISEDFMRYKQEWPRTKPLVIDWKMPEGYQRVMLFEKLETFLETRLRRQNKGMSEEKLADLEHAKFRPLIKIIKCFYHKFDPLYKSQVDDFDYTGEIQWLQEESKDQHKTISAGEKTPNSKKASQSSNFDDFRKASGDLLLSHHSGSQMSAIDAQEKFYNEQMDDPQRIVKWSYGKSGLINFLRTLFGPACDDDKTEGLNYYWQVIEMLDRLDNYDPDVMCEDPLFCEFCKKRQNKHEEMQKFNHETHYQIIQSEKILLGHQTRFVEDCVAPNMWMMPHEVRNYYREIRKSTQFIMLAIKLTSKFADKIDGRERAFLELLKWPKNQEDCFPKNRLLYFFGDLTLSQKSELAEIFAQFKKKCNEVIGDDKQQSAGAILYEEKKDDSKQLQREPIEQDFILKLLNAQVQLEYFRKVQIASQEDSQEKKKLEALMTTDVDAVFKFDGNKSLLAFCIKAVVEDNYAKKEDEEKKQKHEVDRRMSMQLKPTEGTEMKARITKDKKDKKERGFFSRLLHKDKKDNEKTDKKVQLQYDKLGSSAGSQGKKVNAKNTRTSDKMSAETKKSQASKSSPTPGASNEETKDGRYEGLGINASIVSSATFQDSALMQSQARIQAQSSMEPQECKLECEYNGVKKSIKLMNLILKFWQAKSKEMGLQSLDHRPVDQKILPFLQEELAQIKAKAVKTLNKHFSFDLTKDYEDTQKQCFWLNILNFMTLFRLAEIKLIKPAVFKALDRFPMWMGFMHKNYIEISGVKLSQETIFTHILRYVLPTPGFTQVTSIINLDGMETNFRMDDERCKPVQHLVVQHPHIFVSFGLYLPINKFPMLRIFRKETFDQQLKSQVASVLSTQLGAQEQRFYVQMPKIMKWFVMDFEYLRKFDQQQSPSDVDKGSGVPLSGGKLGSNQAELRELCLQKDLLNYLEVLNDNLDGDEFKLKEIVSEIKQVKQVRGTVKHKMEFKKFEWKFAPEFYHDSLKAAIAEDAQSENDT